MKAKLYILGALLEIRLSDDSVYKNAKNESREDFEERVTRIVQDELLDDEFDLIVIDKETVATNDDKTLLDAFESAEGLQKELIKSVLEDRKLLKAKAKKEKAPTMTAEEMKASDHYKDAEANIGKHVTFSPFKSEEVLKGKIAGVALSKTNTIVYYTVVLEDGKRKCCAVKNESIKFVDAPAGSDKEPVKKLTKAQEKAAKAAEAKAAKAKAAKNATNETSTPKTEPQDVAGDDLGTSDDDLM